MKRLPKMNQLTAFEAVSRAGSINQAAKNLGQTQSTLSRAVRELEETLGIQLFTRGGSGVILTPAGECFRRYASSALRELEAGIEETEAVNGRTGHTVSFAVPTFVTRSILNAAMTRLMQSEPRCRINVEVATFQTSLDRMRLGILDFAVGTTADRSQLADFDVEPLMACPVAVACAKDHPLRNATSLSALENADWLISPEYELYNERCPGVLDVLHPAHAVETDGYFLTNQLLARNDFFSILSSVQIRRHSDYLAVVPVAGFPYPVEYVLACPKDRPRPRMTERLLAYLRQEATDYDWSAFTMKPAEAPFRSLAHDMGKVSPSSR